VQSQILGDEAANLGVVVNYQYACLAVHCVPI